LSAVLQNYMHELETGSGFMLIRGIPVERFDDDDEINSIY